MEGGRKESAGSCPFRAWLPERLLLAEAAQGECFGNEGGAQRDAFVIPLDLHDTSPFAVKMDPPFADQGRKVSYATERDMAYQMAS